MSKLLDLLQRSVIFSIFAVLVVCVSWQVITRYVLGVPSTTTDEVARFLFIWLALIGGAYTYGQGRHLAIDILPQSLTGVPHRIVMVLITLLIAGFAGAVLVWGGWDLVARTLAQGQISPTLRLPMGYVYMALPVSGVMILAYAVRDILSQIRDTPVDRDTPDMPVE